MLSIIVISSDVQITQHLYAAFCMCHLLTAQLLPVVSHACGRQHGFDALLQNQYVVVRSYAHRPTD